MVDYTTERRKTEKRKMFPITGGGPTTQREEVLYEKEKFLNFIVCVCVFVCLCFNRFEGVGWGRK
jgi:hypothetical protein